MSNQAEHQEIRHIADLNAWFQYDSLMVMYMMLGQIGTQNLVFIQFSQYQKLIASFPEQEYLSRLQWFIAQVSHSLIKSERMKQHFSRQFLVMCSVLQQFTYFHNPRGSEYLCYSPNRMAVCPWRQCGTLTVSDELSLPLWKISLYKFIFQQSEEAELVSSSQGSRWEWGEKAESGRKG